MFGKIFSILFSCAALFIIINATGYCPDSSGTVTAQACDLACQFSNNGSFYANAFSCSNQLADSTCATLFPCSGSCSTINGYSTVSPVGTSAPYVRAYACTASSTYSLALQCARQCGICCLTAAYNCTDASNSPISCSANIGNCNSASFKSIMQQYCPSTCGLCAGNCTDAVSGCSTLSSLCQNINWYTYMQTNCASTCGTCSTTTTASTSSCSDVASNCAANSNLCSNSIYYTLMTQQCPKTCGRCSSSSSSSSSSCTDSSSSCSSWKTNGFCSSSFYTTAQKKQYCASSCSLC